MGSNAHNHVSRLRAIADWSPWTGHYGITQYIKVLMPHMWTFRERTGLHLLQKSFVDLDTSREATSTFARQSLHGPFGMSAVKVFVGAPVFFSVEVDRCLVLVRLLFRDLIRINTQKTTSTT